MSKKNMDNKNRWRNKTIAFRMSPEESELLNKFVSISGLTKQDYIISRVLKRDIVVVGNPRTYKALRNLLYEVLKELKRIERFDSENDELICLISQINFTLNGFVCS